MLYPSRRHQTPQKVKVVVPKQVKLLYQDSLRDINKGQPDQPELFTIVNLEK